MQQILIKALFMKESVVPTVIGNQSIDKLIKETELIIDSRWPMFFLGAKDPIEIFIRADEQQYSDPCAEPLPQYGTIHFFHIKKNIPWQSIMHLCTYPAANLRQLLYYFCSVGPHTVLHSHENNIERRVIPILGTNLGSKCVPYIRLDKTNHLVLHWTSIYQLADNNECFPMWEPFS